MKAFIRKYQIGLTVLMLILIGYILFYNPNKDPHLIAVQDILKRGNNMIKKDIIYRDCTRVEFNRYPELSDKFTEAVKMKMVSEYYDESKPFIGQPFTSVFPPKGKSCFKNMKLVNLEYSYDIHGNYEAVFRCEKNGVGEELKVGYFQKSCSYTAYLTKWDFPVGKYTMVSQP
ncbi:hypothetical protein [Acinetobacter sp. NIPH 298]|uniref:hypothetical protein n=1 Tax=Acinetobacter sp. NIPH 298 TaxID=1217692 RepID=UPI0002D026F2|nr:hypothetical protein [Acinetobacter sp. NIPH 298]ENW94925.1 hypothetical protein F903_02601 [Acinetobacter sp. NIPH 298]